MITIKDIAKKCGVSASTVSRALADSKLLPASTKKKINDAAKELGYVKNEMASSLKTGINKTVGVINFVGENLGFSNYFFAGVLNGFSNRMNKLGYEIYLISPYSLYDEANALNNLKSKRLSGVVMLSGHLSAASVKLILESGIPSVVVDPRDKEILDMANCVSSDNFKGMYDLTFSAISKGHRNIVYVCGEGDQFVTGERISGFKKALFDGGIEFNDKMIVEGNYYNLSNVKKIIDDLLKREDKPTCVFMPDDYCAVHAYEILSGRNVRVGQDISVAGFDGIELGRYMHPNITTVEQDSNKIGKVAAELLHEAISGRTEKKYVKLSTALIETDSVLKLNRN